ncbi:MAG TPA: ATP-binding protein [Thermoanaerobaculia bacterium]|nr:ATP-binding protein [Thermoanaerobaculia bacterium]
MIPGRMGLRTFLSGVMVVLTVLSLSVALALILLTSFLDEAVTRLASSLESVRVAEEMQVDLLLHGETQDGLLRAEKEARLHSLLEEAKGSISFPGEGRLLEVAENRVDEYLAAARNPPAADKARQEAFLALEDLVRLNLRHARETQREAAWLNELANYVGGGTAIAFLLGIVAVLLWLRGFAFRPVFRIAEAMRQFGRGDKGARAPETGPQELRDIAGSFNAMAEALSRQHENQMAFLAGVAHDLRNPLSALKMSSAMIGPEAPLPPEERIRHLLALVQRQVDRLDRMVGDFLDAARIEAGQLDLKIEEWDARDLAREVFELFRASSPQHEIELALPAEPVPLCCDPVRIEQVLNNFVSNAIKYSPRGGGVGITVETSRGETVFSVSDSGIGLSAEDLDAIFEPFHRARSSRDSIPGVGLGLFVARRIVEAHGGRIEVESLKDAGSTFRVRLPGTG